ncbi:MAG: MEDS domain-containing protein [Syntrophomonadaceae bacterium]|nr:MEDS domain-containing protein [Syntrophomonadaceae bacterium]
MFKDSDFQKSLKNLKPRDHICLIHETSGDWYNMVMPFFASGLERNEKCIYISDRQPANEIWSCLANEGVDIASVQEASQLLFLGVKELFFNDNEVDPFQTIFSLMEKIENSLAEGYDCIRITFEMDWLLQYKLNETLIIEFEARLNRYFFSRYPCISLCQYPLRQLEPTFIKDIIRNHPLVMHNKQICRNSYYVPPRAFLSKYGDEAELKYLINKIELDHEQTRSGFVMDMLKNSTQPCIAVYPHSRLIRHNDVFQQMLGYSDHEMEQLAWEKDLIPTELLNYQTEFHEKSRDPGKPLRLEKELTCKDMRRLPVELTVHQLHDKDGNIELCYAFVTDITERKELEKRLEYLSLYDSLTGLGNRLCFEQEMQRIEKRAFNCIGLILCDFDGLKLINDTIGHTKGNTLLITLADILRNCFEDDIFMARIGGDEFIVLLPDVSAMAVEAASSRVKKAISSYRIKNNEPFLNVSVGFASVSMDNKKTNHLLKEAENSMFRQKMLHRYSGQSTESHILNKTLDARDIATEGHTNHLIELVTVIAAANNLPETIFHNLRLLAEFHDIGKIGVSGDILLKPGPLNNAEKNEMQRHTHIGSRIAASSRDLSGIADWILKHHEHWDGQGYPLGLKEEEIPLECRILAIADAYDAMTSNRPYRKAMPKKTVLQELRKCAGRQFDPVLIPRFIEAMSKC